MGGWGGVHFLSLSFFIPTSPKEPQELGLHPSSLSRFHLCFIKSVSSHRWDVFRTLLSERETSSRHELFRIQQLSIFTGLRSPESQVSFSCRMRLEGKVPSFVSGLLFLQHPAETRHRLDPSTSPLRGFPAGLSARRPPRDAAVWAAGYLPGEDGP